MSRKVFRGVAEMRKVVCPVLLFASASMTVMAQQAPLSTNADMPPIWQLGGHPAPGPNTRENAPFKVDPVKPTIVYGPLILDPGETTATIEWITDAPSTAKVLYGENTLDHVAEPQEDAMLPVDTFHRIELTGLLPGHTYKYQISSTRVVHLTPYQPEMGLAVESPVYSFTTFDSAKPVAAFNTITDTHGRPERVSSIAKLIDWNDTDFLVHTGDGVDWVDSEDQIFNTWIDPMGVALHAEKPLLFARGNHDLRGPFARQLAKYLAAPEGRFYFTRDDGPLHLIVLDTGEDKPDATKAYSGLLRQEPYRAEELAWFRNHFATDKRAQEAPFRVVLMHQPDWGWLDQKNSEWTEVANAGHVDLVIAGHFHHFVHFATGVAGNTFPVLSIAPDETAHVRATKDQLEVTVIRTDGTIVDQFTLPRRGKE
ncbi:metallophosphoesterase [Silvibacterium acidisoli]|uniref:metallophosphoesterase n=1 Tax=Acidobacteriaceae bacterium ZG23-2 TaxID=2883246 RepID=UPI00406C1539